jgi:predicted GH43/DUF377 family glycosyl hydrolase
MSVQILYEKVVLRPNDLQPLDSRCEIIGTFNPAAIRFQEEIILLVRIAERPYSKDMNAIIAPRAKIENGQLEWIHDTFESTGVETRDPRKFTLPDGRQRLNSISHLCLIRLSPDGKQIKEILTPTDLQPQEHWEELGIEDPRITQINDTFYITYVAVSRSMGVATALITTHDFRTFKRHGIIFPTENKDIVLLPEKWKGHFVAYHRPVSHHTFNLPSIETALSANAICWGQHQFLFGPRTDKWDSVKIGAGAPPVRLPEGWLLIYHGVSSTSSTSPGGFYSAGAALLDTKNPLQLIARSGDPLLSPERDYEKHGFMPNVIFPTGAILSGDGENLMLFSGAADEVVTLKSIPIKSILQHLDVESG